MGALQGAADTLRTLAAMVGSPLMSRVFGMFLGGKVSSLGHITQGYPQGALFVASTFSFAAYAMFLYIRCEGEVGNEGNE